VLHGIRERGSLLREAGNGESGWKKLLLCASLELVKKYKKTPIAMPSVYWQAKPST